MEATQLRSSEPSLNFNRGRDNPGAELDDLTFARAAAREIFERVVEHDVACAAAALLIAPRSRVVDEDPADDAR